MASGEISAFMIGVRSDDDTAASQIARMGTQAKPPFTNPVGLRAK